MIGASKPAAAECKKAKVRFDDNGGLAHEQLARNRVPRYLFHHGEIAAVLQRCGGAVLTLHAAVAVGTCVEHFLCEILTLTMKAACKTFCLKSTSRGMCATLFPVTQN